MERADSVTSFQKDDTYTDSQINDGLQGGKKGKKEVF